MKRALLFLFLLMFVFAPPAQAQCKNEQTLRGCRAVADMAEMFMEMRQKGISLKVALAIVNGGSKKSSPSAKKLNTVILMEAYDYPVSFYESEKKEFQKYYKELWYHRCCDTADKD